jgi:hypothetical protein
LGTYGKKIRSDDDDYYGNNNNNNNGLAKNNIFLACLQKFRRESCDNNRLQID